MINHKKLLRLYRQEKLAVRRRGGRKRAIGARAPMTVPMTPNERRSLDFLSDQLTDGRRFRILTVVDDCTREYLAPVADTSLSGTRVAWELDRLMIERGKPKMVVSDNGSELTNNAILTCDQSRVAWHYIAPGALSRRRDKLAHPHRAFCTDDQAIYYGGPVAAAIGPAGQVRLVADSEYGWFKRPATFHRVAHEAIRRQGPGDCIISSKAHQYSRATAFATQQNAAKQKFNQ